MDSPRSPLRLRASRHLAVSKTCWSRSERHSLTWVSFVMGGHPSLRKVLMPRGHRAIDSSCPSSRAQQPNLPKAPIGKRYYPHLASVLPPLVLGPMFFHADY